MTPDRIAALEAENADLRKQLHAAKQAYWFYLGEETASEDCQFSIDDVITESWGYDNRPEGQHVLLVSGARPVADMWVALRFYTDAEKDARDSDDEYFYTVHATEADARAALQEQPNHA